MQKFSKLVRDKIPEIIFVNGERPITRILNKEEFAKELDKKLQEEVKEYLKDGNIEELADILEVLHGILLSRDKKFSELEKVRLEKLEKRGGFEKRIFLEGVEKEQ